MSRTAAASVFHELTHLLESDCIAGAILLAILLSVFFAPIIFSDSTLLTAAFVPQTMPGGPYAYPGDAVRHIPVMDPGATGWATEPWDKLISRMYQSGQLPLWNPHQAAGTPLAANMQSAPFYPVTAVANLVPDHYWPYVRDLGLLFQLFLAGLFTLLFARSIGAGPIGAVGAASAYMFTGYLMLYIGMHHQHVEVLIPALLWGYERLLTRGGVGAVFLVAAIVCLSILGGMPEAFFFSFVFAGLYYTFRTVAEARARTGPGRPRFILASLARGLGPAILGILLAAFCLLPFVEYLALSHHVHPPERGIGLAYYPLRTAISILVPYFLGWPFEGWHPDSPTTVFTVLYTGILPLALAFVAVLNHRRVPRVSYFFAAVCGFFVLKAYGAPVVNWIGLLPGFNVSVFPHFARAEFSFSLAILAGFGLDTVRRRQAGVRSAAIVACLLTAIIAAFTFSYARDMITYDATAHVLRQLALSAGFIAMFALIFLAGHIRIPKRTSSPGSAGLTAPFPDAEETPPRCRDGATVKAALLQRLIASKPCLLLFLSAAILFLSFRAAVLATPPFTLNVGDYDDELYVHGFHQREANEWSTFRWTKAHSSITVPGARNLPATITLALNGWRPEGEPGPRVRVVAHGQELANVIAKTEMTSYQIEYTPGSPSLSTRLVLDIYAETFSPPTDAANRTLGVLVDSVEVRPTDEAWWRSDWLSIGALCAAIAISYLVLRSLGMANLWAFAGSLAILALLSLATMLSLWQTLQYALFVPVVVLAVWGPSCLVRRIVPGRAWLQPASLLLGLLVLELYIYLPKDRAQRYDPFTPPPYLEFLQRDTEPHRVLGLDLVLYPETASAYGVDDAGHVDAMLVARYSSFVARFICPECFMVTSQGAPLYDSKFVDLLNVKYLLTAYPLPDRWRSIDLMAPGRLEQCKALEGQREVPLAVETQSFGDDSRTVLVQRLPSRLECTVGVPRGFAFLALGASAYSADREEQQTAQESVLFEVHVTDSDGQHRVFSEEMRPEGAIVPTWHDTVVDLSSFQGQEVTITFATSTESPTAATHLRAGWSNLALLRPTGDFATMPGCWTLWLPRDGQLDGVAKKWELVYEDEIKVYRNNQVLPRAFIVHHAQVVTGETEVLDTMDSPSFDPRTTVVLEEELPAGTVQALEVIPPEHGSTARIVDYEPGRVSIETTLGRPGFLVLTDTYYPGWKASVDGHESKIYAADYLFRAVHLEGGKHTVQFIYDPLSFKVGLCLGVGTLLGILVYVIMTKARLARAKQ